MTSKLTKERLLEIAEDGFLKHGESKELARMALAENASEPVILYRERNPYNGLTTGWQELTENEFSFLKENTGENAEFLTLYRHAQPAPEKYNIGDATMLHIFTPTGMTNVSDMQAVFDRVEAVLVGMDQPAPVVPKSISVRQAISALESADAVTTIGQAYKMGWNACRAAMLQELQKSAGDSNNCRGSENMQVVQVVQEKVLCGTKAAPTLDYSPKKAESRCGNSPVIGIDLASGPDRTVEVHYVAPPGYVMVPREPTDEMIAAAMNCEDVLFNSDDSFCVQFGNIYEAMLAAAPQPQNAPQNIPEIIPGWIQVSERMPEAGGDMIVFTDGIVMSGVSYAKKKGFYIQALEYDDDEPVDSVTHWMPLPAGPKEVKGE